MNACIVGYGAVGPVHAAAVGELDGSSVFAVCDRDPGRAALCRETYGCLIYEDFDEMLKDSAIDVVHICTPHYLHKEMAEKALLAGKHVVLEKPVVLTLRDMEELTARADKSDGRLCIMLQNRRNACIEALRAIVRREPVGALRGVIGNVYWKRDEAYYQRDAWRGKWATEGGGAVINQAIHMLDLMIYFGGRVKHIDSAIHHWRIPGIEVEDNVEALIDFEGGARGVFHATNCYVTDEPYILELLFERAHYRYADGCLYEITPEGARVIARDERIKIGRSYWGNGHSLVIRSFYEAICGGEAPYTDIRDAYETMRTVFAIYEGAKGPPEKL